MIESSLTEQFLDRHNARNSCHLYSMPTDASMPPVEKIIWRKWKRGTCALTLSLRTNLAIGNFPEVTHTLSFYPRASKLNLFAIYGQWVPRYGPIFKICHIWAWNLAISQSSKSCKYTPFLPQGVKIKLIFTLLAAVSEIQAYFQTRGPGALTLCLVSC